MRSLFVAAVLLAGMQPALAQKIEFAAPVFEGTANDAIIAAFVQDKPSRSVRVPATLTIPSNAQGPVPTVIVAHTSGGPGGDVRQAADYLLKAGYATLLYDSYAPRGFRDNTRPGTGPAKLELNQAADAYLALRELARLPQLDAKRIGYIGMSAGGNAAMVAAAGWVRARYAGAEGPRFAALIGVYPGGFVLPAAADLGGAPPILAIGAEKDDYMAWTRFTVWLDYVKRENAAVPIETLTILGASHSFLNPQAKGGSPDAPSVLTCPHGLVAQSEGPLAWLLIDGTVSSATPTPGCAKRGGTTMYSPQASTIALNAAHEFFKKAFAAAR